MRWRGASRPRRWPGEHNNAQLIGIGGRMHTVEEALSFVDAFLATPWSKAERHQRRIDILAEYERTHQAPPVPGARLSEPPCPKGIPCIGWPGCISVDMPGHRWRSRSPQGRFAAAAAVDGRVLRRASAWGKHLFHHYADGPIVHVHLGLYGTFTEWERPTTGRCQIGRTGADADGRRRLRHRLAWPDGCELIDEAQVADVVARLGPDPLRADADPAWPWARITKSRRPIGALLMDQTVIAGVGNVYRNELLFRHRIDPFRPAGRSAMPSSTRHGPTWST